MLRAKQLSTSEARFIDEINKQLNEGWTWEQIATARGTSVSSVRNRYVRIDYRRLKLKATSTQEVA